MAHSGRLSYHVRESIPGKNRVGQFGDKFRKAREAKKFSLDDVSNVTKISSRMLKAIEDENFDQLPGGIFNKGFIRSYAKHLGLNDEEAVNDYLATTRRAQLEAQKVWSQPEPSPRTAPPVELPHLQLPRPEHVRPPAQKYLDRGQRHTPWPLIAVACVTLVLAAILWIRHSHHAHTVTAEAAPAPPQSTLVPVSAVTPSNPVPPASGLGNPNSASSPARNSTSQNANTGTSASPISPSAAKAAAPSTTTSSPQPESPETATSKPAPLKPLALVIRAAENSWISVTADGQPVLRETLIAPASISVHAAHDVTVRIGNAAALTFVWNGAELPAQGAESEVKTLLFDADGLHEIAPAPAVQNQ